MKSDVARSPFEVPRSICKEYHKLIMEHRKKIGTNLCTACRGRTVSKNATVRDLRGDSGGLIRLDRITGHGGRGKERTESVHGW